MPAPTETDYENAGLDLVSLGQMANGSAALANPGHDPGTVTTRLGTIIKTLARVMQDLTAVPYNTYAELAALTPFSGTPAQVLAADAGTHTYTDPVTGVVTNNVPNGGYYIGVVGPSTAAWKRIGSSQADLATAAAANALASVSSAYDIQAELGRGPLTPNLFDTARRTLGSYIDAAGTISSSANYVLSDKMRVKTGLQYVFGNAGATGFSYRWLGSNGTTVLSFSQSGVSGTPITAPANAYYLQVSVGPNQDSRTMVVQGSTLPTSYVAAGFEDPATSRSRMMTSALALVYAMAPLAVNIVDASRFSDGYAMQPDNGSTYSFAGYTVSDLTPQNSGTVVDNCIPVKESTQYISNTSLVVAYFDQLGVYLSQATITASSAFTTPIRAAFIRFHLNPTTLKSSIMIVRGSTLPTSYVAFGYPTTTTVNTTALTQARTAQAEILADDANLNNPTSVLYNRAVSPANGAVYAATAYGASGSIPVVPGDYISVSIGNNGHAFFNESNSFVYSTAALNATGSATGNVVTISSVTSGSIAEGQSLAASGYTSRRVIRQLSGPTGGAGTYLTDVAQDIPGGTTITSTNGSMPANTWIKVPAGAYYFRFQGTPMASVPGITVRRGKSAQVNRAVFTAQIAAGVMTISTLTSGQPLVGDLVTGPGVTPGTTITTMPTNGGTGAYGVSISQTVNTDTAMQSGIAPTVAPRSFGSSPGVGLNWSGKKAYLQGDSQVNNGLFQGTLGSLTGLSITSQGTPGRAMAGGATAIASVDLSQYDMIINDHMTNDFGGGRPLGTIADDKTVASFYGDMDLWLYNVLSNASYRNKRVVFFGATPRTDTVTNGIGLKLSDYNEAMRVFCKKWSIPFCDLFSTVGFNTYNYTSGSSDLTGDGLHYNTAGGLIVGRVKGNFINLVA